MNTIQMNRADVISDTEKRIKGIVDQIGWDFSDLISQDVKSSNYYACSINPQHRLPGDVLEAHEARCSLKSEGYSPNDMQFPESSQSSNSSLQLTLPQLKTIFIEAKSNDPSFIGAFDGTLFPGLLPVLKLFMSSLLSGSALGDCPSRSIPKTANKFLEWYTRDERLALYDYVVAHTEKKPVVPVFEFRAPDNASQSKEMTPWELAAAQRDAKRRRTSYKNKVHTNRKTHTEILREVIQTQISTIVDTASSEADPAESKPHTSADSRRHDNRSYSRDDRKYDRRSSSYSREREKYDRSRGHGDKKSYERESDRKRNWRDDRDHRRKRRRLEEGDSNDHLKDEDDRDRRRMQEISNSKTAEGHSESERKHYREKHRSRRGDSLQRKSKHKKKHKHEKKKKKKKKSKRHRESSSSSSSNSSTITANVGSGAQSATPAEDAV